MNRSALARAAVPSPARVGILFVLLAHRARHALGDPGQRSNGFFQAFFQQRLAYLALEHGSDVRLVRLANVSDPERVQGPVAGNQQKLNGG